MTDEPISSLRVIVNQHFPKRPTLDGRREHNLAQRGNSNLSRRRHLGVAVRHLRQALRLR